MKTPAFWQTKNVLSTLLLPLSAVYWLAATLRKYGAPKPEPLSIPVICIGNLTAGGSGKTPTAIAIAERLKAKNVNAYFLSRGYGGSLVGPVLVNPDIHTAREVGDEPLLLARTLPTVVAKDRRAGAFFAIEQGAFAIVMDDGLQNITLAKTLSLLVMDGRYGFGNGRLLPAGPLRETPASGLAHIDAGIVIGDGSFKPSSDVPVIPATLAPSPAAVVLRGRSVFAFCGIAYPQKFFDTLTLLGANIVGSVSFPDHYLYREGEMKKLAERAKHANGILVTTAKDAVRLRAEWKSLVTVVDVTLTFPQPEPLDALLDKALRQTW